MQKLRKDYNFSVADRILLKFMTACPIIASAVNEHSSYIMTETLATELLHAKEEKDLAVVGSSTHLPSFQEIDDKTVIVSMSRLQG